MKSKTLWTKTLSEEFWSGVVSPLMFSIAGELIEERMARKGMRLAGLDGLENEGFFRLFGGQVYLNSHFLEEIVGMIPSTLLTPEMLRFFPREIQEDLSQIRVSFFSPGTLRILSRLFVMDRDWAPFLNYRAFQTAVGRLEDSWQREQEGVDLKGMTIPQLLDRSRRLCQEMGDFLDVVTWGMVFAYVFHPLTAILARKWGGDNDGELANALTVGLEGIKTFEISREIEALAQRVDTDPYLRRLFERRRSKSILKELQRPGQGDDFHMEFRSFMAKHGHRFHGRDIQYMTWKECPEMVIDMIKMNRGSDLCQRTLDRQISRRNRACTALKGRIKQGPLGSLKLALFSLSLEYNQRYFVVRENMRYYSDYFLEHFRKLYLDIGERWYAMGMLKHPTDIVFLTKEEIEEVRDQEGKLLPMVGKRKSEYARYRHLRTPEVITDNTRLESLTRLPFPMVSVLDGEVASPGRVSGLARVVRRPKDLLDFEKGEILVAEYIDPSWTPILSLAAGIVIQVGGFLSHGSIVAREYGIPALIQVEGLLEQTKTGDRLELDSEQKMVRIERD